MKLRNSRFINLTIGTLCLTASIIDVTLGLDWLALLMGLCAADSFNRGFRGEE